MKLRTNPTCPHCFAENPGDFQRQVIVDGARDIDTCCAMCGTPMGDSEELVIPVGVQEIFKALVQRCTFRVSSFFTQENCGSDSISMENRAEPAARCTLDWRPLELSDQLKPGGKPAFQVVELPEQKLKMLPPILQSTVRLLQHQKLTMIEGTVNVLHHDCLPKGGRIDSCIRFRGTTHVTIQANGTEREYDLLIRVQLSWCQPVSQPEPDVKLDLEPLFKQQPAAQQ